MQNNGPLEMLARYAGSLASFQAWIVPCFVLSLLLAFAAVPEARRPLVYRITLTAAVLGALAHAWQLRWLCDDAYISFRYTERLLRGEGLVFNVGERIEGYTNFLWTVLLAIPSGLGADIGQAAIVISMACFAGVILLTARISRDHLAQIESLAIPFAVLVVASHYSMASFATSGLETMFGALLALVALERALNQRWIAAGLAGVLAAMTHPDHGILYAALGLSIVTHGPSRRGIFRYALPFAVVYVPYFLWRYNYYGDLFPNTYYAKSASDAYFSQGFNYLGAFFLGGGLWATAPLGLYGAWMERRTLLGRYVTFAAPLFCLYVAKIGGDFMHGRLLCVLVAPLALIVEAGARHLLAREKRGRLFAGLVFASLVFVPTTLFAPME